MRFARVMLGYRWALLVLLALGACTSLPTVATDAQQPAAVVRLAGPRGPLTASQSHAILARLRNRSANSSIFDHHLAREEAIVGSPLTTGNTVKLLQDGPATYQPMFEAIAAAKDHINMETYILEDDEVGHQFAQALIGKQRKGVQVNIIRDGVGSFNTAPAFLKSLGDSGIRLLEFNPVNPLASRTDWELNQRDHRKLLIVDGVTAFLGGINISNVYSGGSSHKKPAPTKANAGLAWRDTDLQLRGPVVAELQKLFLATWSKQNGPPLAASNFFPAPGSPGTQLVRAIGSSPDDPFSLIYATLLSAIGSADSSIHLTTAYFVPDPQLLVALEAAVARGVRVTLILPAETDSWLTLHAGRASFDRLLSAGVAIHERRGVLLHSKTALIDGVWSTVGSTNLDWRSFLHNDEVNAVILGADFGKQMQAMFDKDLIGSRPITLEQWRQRSLNVRLKEFFARMWEYWL